MEQFFKDFVDHPHSVGETYLQHWCSAMRFSLLLAGCALACLVHAFLPGLCKTTASRSVTRLHDRMVTHRHRRHAAAGYPQETSARPSV